MDESSSPQPAAAPIPVIKERFLGPVLIVKGSLTESQGTVK